MDKLILNADKNADKMDFENTLNCKSLLLFTEMDASLVGAPDFKPARAALTLSQIGSIPMHLRHAFQDRSHQEKKFLIKIIEAF